LKSILQQLDGLPPGDFKLAIVDGKGEYDYVDLVRPQHFVPEFSDVLLGHSHAAPVLQWLVEVEVVRRRTALRTYFAQTPDAPRSPMLAYVRARATGRSFPIAPLVIVIDEFAEIMLAAGASARTFEDLVQRVVQAGRSALVHLVLATQRPDANVLAGAIKANMPSRIALSLPSHHDSMTVLNSTGAEDLLGRGDLIFQSSTGERVRLQGFNPRT
jgi:S-DNA-T family DNA segregation ATPase FtsK/SpoIIIE